MRYTVKVSTRDLVQKLERLFQRVDALHHVEVKHGMHDLVALEYIPKAERKRKKLVRMRKKMLPTKRSELTRFLQHI